MWRSISALRLPGKMATFNSPFCDRPGKGGLEARRGSFSGEIGWAVEHGVADVDCVDAAVAEIFFFEGEDAAEGVDDLGDFFDAPGARGPDLRGDVVADGDFFFPGDGGDAEVDSGGIDGDDDIRLEGAEFGADFLEALPPIAAFGEEGADEHGTAADGVGDEATAGGSHAFTADADEAGIGEAFPQRVDEGGAKGIAGVFGSC